MNSLKSFVPAAVPSDTYISVPIVVLPQRKFELRFCISLLSPLNQSFDLFRKGLLVLTIRRPLGKHLTASWIRTPSK